MKKFMVTLFKKYKCFLKKVIDRVSSGHGYEECE